MNNTYCDKKLKIKYHKTLMGGWVCFLSHNNKKEEVYGDFVAPTKEEAYQMSLKKLQQMDIAHD